MEIFLMGFFFFYVYIVLNFLLNLIEYGKMVKEMDKENIEVLMEELLLENGLMTNYSHLVDFFNGYIICVFQQIIIFFYYL